jgi:hypothetical protein
VHPPSSKAAREAPQLYSADMLNYLRHNWLAPLAIALAFTFLSTLMAGFDAGRAIVIFLGLFFVNYLVGLLVHLLVDRRSNSTR